MADDRLGVEHLHFETRGPIAWCRVDRPEARNALTRAMYAGLGKAVSIANLDPDIGALIITGTEDVFIPGGDLGTTDAEDNQLMLSAILPWNTLRASLVPTVTAINGICFASGVMFALLSDIAVASDRATFRVPELVRGFPDTWLASVLPAHVGVGRARELALTNRKIGAVEAHAIGLVERVVPDEDLPQAAEEAAYEMLECAPLARGLFRQAANAHYGRAEEITMNWGPESPEAAEGFAAFIEKRSPAWSPSRHTSEGERR